MKIKKSNATFSSIVGIGQKVKKAESLLQDNFCKVCNLPTDGEKCYSKRCPI